MKSIRPKRILVADDDPSIRAALRATLEADGYEVSLAPDGRAAIEALIAHTFDLAILDLAMPHADGLEVLRRLRENERTAAIPVILHTSRVLDAGERERVAGLGASQTPERPGTRPVLRP